jgi:T5SS/PEP-CTERM-associated repeat protein
MASHFRVELRFSISAVTTIGLVVTLTTASHATKYWKDSVGSGNWNVGDNWSAISAADADNGGVPTPNEGVRIVHTDGTERTVTLDVTPPSLGPMYINSTPGPLFDILAITTDRNLAANAIFVGGHNGSGDSNGRGAIAQSAGTVTTNPGTDLWIGYGAGSTGVYTLTGTGALVASQSEYIGFSGTGTFTHANGTHTINASATVQSLALGFNAGSLGTYNLRNNGQLISNSSEYVGWSGTGVFNHTGGSNLILNGKDLQLGFNSSGNGTYTISNNASLSVANNLVVGASGTGTLTIQGEASVHVTNALNINNSSTVNLSGGTLRFNTVTGLNRVNFNSGTIQLGGNRTVGGPAGDAIISGLFGVNPVIDAGKNLTVEGTATLGTTLTLNGGSFSANQVINPQLLQVQHGTLEVANQAATIGAGQTLDLAADASINYGLGITNHGLIKGDGQLGGAVFQNAALGEVLAEANKSLTFAAENNENDGKISMIGGSLLFVQQLINKVAGKINGYGTINLDDDLVNHGEINVADVMQIHANGPDADFMNHGNIDVAGNLSIEAAKIELDGLTQVAQDKTLNLITTATTGVTQGIVSGTVQLTGGTISANNGLLFGTPGLLAQAESVVSAISVQLRENYNQAQQNIADFAAQHASELQQLPPTAAAELQTLIKQQQAAKQGVQDVAAQLNACQHCLGNFQSTIIADTEVLGTIIAGGNKGVGNVEFVGDLSMDIGSSLELELSGVNQGQFDKLNVDGNVSFEIGSQLAISTLDPGDLQNGTNLFLPAVGVSFDVISADSIDAEFIVIDAPPYDDRLFVAGVVNTPSGQSLRITVVPFSLPGDFNNDGSVDAADYVVWRKTGSPPADYITWRTNFGRTAGGGSVSNTTVPEPAAGLLIVLGAAVGCWGITPPCFARSKSRWA